MTGKALADVTAEERKGAKCVNFGTIYGQGAAGWSRSPGTNFDIVLDLRRPAHGCTRSRPPIRFDAVAARTLPSVVERGYIVIGKDARTRHRPNLAEEPRSGRRVLYTRCCNLPVQGACADASMLALAYVDDRLFDAGIDGGPVAWLHDEIVLEVRDDQAERAAEILKQAMIDGFIETFPGAPINGLVEPHVGMSWAEKS